MQGTDSGHMSSNDDGDAPANHDGLPVTEGNEMVASRATAETASGSDLASLGNFPMVGQQPQTQPLLPGNLQERLLSHFANQSLLGTQNSPSSLSGLDSMLFGSSLLQPFPATGPSRRLPSSALPLGFIDQTLLHSNLAQNAARSEELGSLLASQPRSFGSGISALAQQGILPLTTLQLQQRALYLAQAERQRRLNELAYFPGLLGPDLSANTSSMNHSQAHLPHALLDSNTASSDSIVQAPGIGARANSIEPSSAKTKYVRDLKSESSISIQLNELKKPPRPLTAYNIFFKHERLRLIDEAAGNGGADNRIPFTVMGKKIGAKWKELSQNEREPYVEAAQQDKVRHQREKEEYNEKKEALLAAHHQKQMSSVKSAVLSKYYEDHQGKRNLPRHPGRDSPDDRKPSARSDCSDGDSS